MLGMIGSGGIGGIVVMTMVVRRILVRVDHIIGRHTHPSKKELYREPDQREHEDHQRNGKDEILIHEYSGLTVRSCLNQHIGSIR